MIADDAILTVAAQAADGDDTAAAILLDLLLENPKQTEWRDERVMMLCLGVPLIPVAPGHLGMQGRRNWHRQRGASIAFALKQWDLYAGRDDFARAVIAVVLFSEWPRGRPGMSPWPMARAADPIYQEQLAHRRERARHYREAERHFAAARAVRDNALATIRSGA